jgi:hypothetical protein
MGALTFPVYWLASPPYSMTASPFIPIRCSVERASKFARPSFFVAACPN